MTAKEYLGRIRVLDFQISQKEKQLAEAKSLQGRVQSFDYSKERVQTSPKGDMLLDKSIKIMTLEQELTERLVELQQLRAKMSDEIASLDNPEHVELLSLRYCNLYRLEAIALEMNLSYHRIRHMHSEALKAFDKKVFKKSKVDAQ